MLRADDTRQASGSPKMVHAFERCKNSIIRLSICTGFVYAHIGPHVHVQIKINLQIIPYLVRIIQVRRKIIYHKEDKIIEAPCYQSRVVATKCQNRTNVM